MAPKDKHYLRLQFQNKIFRKNGTEFQKFFENIMIALYLDFERIKAHGNIGDRKNDGFRKKAGIYYQVYAPENPEIKLKKASEKMKEDFRGLYEFWENIAKIKEFYFVFNDKYFGATPFLCKDIAILKGEFPDVTFDILTSDKLERIFFELPADKLISLGFNIDSREAINKVYEFIENVKIYIDRRSFKVAEGILQNIKSIIDSRGDLELELEIKLLEAKINQSLEKVPEAKELYKKLINMYPNDVRPILNLAEIYLIEGKIEENEELLLQAEEVNSEYWFTKLHRLIKKIHTNDSGDIDSGINEESLPEEKRDKSIVYRIFAILNVNKKNFKKSKEYIEKAIHFNPERFDNYEAELEFLLIQVLLETNNKNKEKLISIFEKKYRKLILKSEEYGGLNPRSFAKLLLKKTKLEMLQDKFENIQTSTSEIYKYLLKCYFDKNIDGMFIDLVPYLTLSEKKLIELLKYLTDSAFNISNKLKKILLLPLIYLERLNDIGVEFYKHINDTETIQFIENLRSNKVEGVISYAKSDLDFMIKLNFTLTDHPEIRKQIINQIPDEKITFNKNMLWAKFYADEENIEKSYEYLKKIDISEFREFEIYEFLKIFKKKEAWEVCIKFTQKLIGNAKEEETRLKLMYELFFYYSRLDNFKECSEIGLSLLNNKKFHKILDNKGLEAFLNNTLISFLEIDEYKKALDLSIKFQKLPKSYYFKDGVEIEIYLRNNQFKKAFESLIETFKILRKPSDEDYAKQHLRLIQLQEIVKNKIKSIIHVQQNSFVKIKDQEKWYFIGNEHALDATKVGKNFSKYESFVGKKINEKVEFPDDKYNPPNAPRIIENILDLNNYVIWKIQKNFELLANQGRLEGVKVFRTIDEQDGQIDISKFLEFFKDIEKTSIDLFNQYCLNNYLPLAFLSQGLGGVLEAKEKIINEKKEFVRITEGTKKEYNYQKNIAEKIIDGCQTFLDSTSIAFMAESGILDKVLNAIPNFRIPQTTINYLYKIQGKLIIYPGMIGNLGYSREKLFFSDLNKSEILNIKNKLKKATESLESKQENIIDISDANRKGYFTEKNMLPEITDASILSEQNESIILTDDFRFLKVNEYYTKKKHPDYCSSYALVRNLYEKGILSFDEYLDYFSYLAKNRFWCLIIEKDDIKKAVYGDGRIKILDSKKIKKFNFDLLFSHEYSYNSKYLIENIVFGFIQDIILDDSLMEDVARKFFKLTIPPLLKGKYNEIIKKSFKQLFKKIGENRKKANIEIPDNHLRKKIEIAKEIISREKSNIFYLI